MRPEFPRPPTIEAIARVFREPSAVWTIDEVAGRFALSIDRRSE